MATSAAPEGATRSIGAVLAQLRTEFPDITISKIRFLESEGLVNPERAASGYRRYGPADFERLRYVLLAQRDLYLPLKVIKEQLDALDRGESPDGGAGLFPGQRAPRSLSAVASPSAVGRPQRIDRAELLERSGADDELLAALAAQSMLPTTPSGFYDVDVVGLVVAARALREAGFDVRHLKAFKLAADREADLIAARIGPHSKGGEKALEAARELTTLALALHSQLVKLGVREALQ